MAVLTALAVVSALGLIMLGDSQVVVLGLVLDCLIFGAAMLLPREDGLLADAAFRARRKGQWLLGYCLAGLSCGAIPVLVTVMNVVILEYFRDHVSNYPVLWWLFSYGVATGAWTFRAQIAPRRNRTLSSIQAYAAHVSYALLSVSVLVFGSSEAVGMVVVIIPQILPFVVGFFLAIADRDALRDVQI